MNLIIEDKVYEHLLFVGDVHGEWLQIAYHAIPNIPVDDNVAIIQVGDFGVGFSKNINGDVIRLKELHYKLDKHNVDLFIIRGNHDDPKWFNDHQFQSDHIDKEGIGDRITLLPDHTILSLNLRTEITKIYCNGGAVSIDRMHRVLDRSYWSDEVFKLPSQEELDQIPNDIDIIATHTRPFGVWPTAKDNIRWWMLEDSQLERDLDKEAHDMYNLFGYIKDKNKHDMKHYYGHFHKSNIMEVDNIEHICLNIKEVREYR